MSKKTEQIDNEVLGMVGEKPVTIMDLCRYGARVGTIRNALTRLLKAQLVKRSWDGNERYGRYVYVRATSPLSSLLRFHFN